MPPIISISLLCMILVLLSIKDFKDGILPDILLIGVAILGILNYGAENGISVAIMITIGYGLYKLYPLIKGEDGLGLGDLKMLAVSGIWLDLTDLPLFFLIGGSVGILTALYWRLSQRGRRFPLGPALALAFGICIVGNYGFALGEDKMTTSFSGPSLPPASGGKPKSIVVFIHGYGSDGDDLISLGQAWAKLLPDTLFVAPHGPTESEQNPGGKQWFGLRDWDPARILVEVHALTPSLNRYLDELLKTHGLPPEKLALVGFSQGAMLALHIGLHRPKCAGIVAFSGAFLFDPSELLIARPPVLLVHGTEDQVLPVTFSQLAEEQLKSINVPTTFTELPGLEHGIDGRALGIGGAFLKEHLYEKAAPNP